MCDASGTDVEINMEKLFTDVTSGGSTPLDHIVYTAGRAPTVKPLGEIDHEHIFQV